MKKLFFCGAVALMLSCTNPSKDFVSVSGKITNKNSDSIVISGYQTKNGESLKYKKVLQVSEDGSFKDTLKIQSGGFSLFDGKEFTSLYLKNGADIHITLDTKEFDETVSFTGKGANENNFLAKSALNQERFFKDLSNLITSPKESFDTKMNDFVSDFDKRITNTSLDTAFVNIQKKTLKNLKEGIQQMREEKVYIATKLANGTVSPIFENYENFKGGTTSLADLKGKYVYIDLWATWCNPCKQEIPHLQKIEKQFHDKNIAFVSISIDDKNDHETWKKMVTNKQLTGVQLFADQAWNSKFVKDYRVSGIPRFILIDKEGKIVNPDAPRPSDTKLLELLNTLSI